MRKLASLPVGCFEFPFRGVAPLSADQLAQASYRSKFPSAQTEASIYGRLDEVALTRLDLAIVRAQKEDVFTDEVNQAGFHRP
jgi:hypothetical protein